MSYRGMFVKAYRPSQYSDEPVGEDMGVLFKEQMIEYYAQRVARGLPVFEEDEKAEDSIVLVH